MKISLVIPCYNEEANLQKGVLDKIGNFTKDDQRFLEVLIVDDGSTDKSREVIKNRYLKHFPKFNLIENPHQGKAYSVITGIKKAQEDWTAFTDMDLATPIEEIEKLINEAGNKYDIVIGSRNRQRKGAPILRKIMAFGGALMRDLFIGLKGIRDTQCGFKLFKRTSALKIIDRLRVSGAKKNIKGSFVSAAFDMEFLFIASKMDYKIKEVPVLWRHVETRNVNFIKDAFESLRDLLTIKYFDLVGKYKIR